MRVAYLDCIGGISGDMALGALLDAGVDEAALVAGLRSLSLPPWELQRERVWKSGIAATHARIIVRGAEAGSAPLLRLPPQDQPLPPAVQGDSHSHAHSHTHPHGHGHTHDYTSEQGHAHDHEHGQAAANAGEGTATFGAVAALIRESTLPKPVRVRATEVYRRLAAAEASVHGTTLDAVHFHEVGAVDSILDVVGAVLGLHLLGVERVICSPLPNGHGFVRCAHGLMPVPPPATAELLKGCPLRPVDVEGELVTPTGAALASALAAEFGPLPALVPRQVGYGAGTRDFPFPNLLRIVIGDAAAAPAEARAVTLLEANLDDQSPELYPVAVEALFRVGALDVWLTPIQMKKGRPGVTLSALCAPEAAERLAEVLFTETTTFGVRWTAWQRECLAREWVEVATPYGPVRVKVGLRAGSPCAAAPEFEECRARAEAAGVPVKQVYAAAAAAYHGGVASTKAEP